MIEVLKEAGMVLVTAAVIGIFAIIRGYLKRRVKIQSPETALIEKLFRKLEELSQREDKRLGRLEQIVPQVARAMMVILRIHLHEETNGDVKRSLDELTETATGLMVSQRGPEPEE